MPRRLIGERAMTATERSARRREREQAYRAALSLIVEEARTIAAARKIASEALAAPVSLSPRDKRQER